MRILLALGFILVAWRWADWKNWRKYYPTYLFMVAVNFITELIMYSHILWQFCPSLLLPNHTVSTIFYSFTLYPSTVLLYLSRYPDTSYLCQVGYIALWVALYSLIEVLTNTLGIFCYQNGWTIWWSILLNIIMFTTLRIHLINPLLAWLIEFVFAVFVLVVFGFSLSDFK